MQTLRSAAGLPPGASLGELQRAAEENTGAAAGRVAAAVQALPDTTDEQRILRLVTEAERERKDLIRRRTW